MAFQTGSDGKLYWAAAGSVPAAEISGVGNVKNNMKRSMAKIQTRGGTTDVNLSGTLDVSVDIEMPWNSSDAGMLAIRNSFKNKTGIGIKSLDAASGLGLDGDMLCETFDCDMPLNDGDKVTIKLVPSANGTRQVTII